MPFAMGASAVRPGPPSARPRRNGMWARKRGGVPMALPVAETAWPYVAPDTRVLVVIPTYNEIENIDEVLRRTRRALPEATVLVVDDNSPDGTGDRVVALRRSRGDLDVLGRECKQG